MPKNFFFDIFSLFSDLLLVVHDVMARNDDDFLFTYFTRYFIGFSFSFTFYHFIYSFVYMRNFLIIFICWRRLFFLFCSPSAVFWDKLSIIGEISKHFTEDKIYTFSWIQLSLMCTQTLDWLSNETIFSGLKEKANFIALLMKSNSLCLLSFPPLCNHFAIPHFSNGITFMKIEGLMLWNLLNA